MEFWLPCNLRCITEMMPTASWWSNPQDQKWLMEANTTSPSPQDYLLNSTIMETRATPTSLDRLSPSLDAPKWRRCRVLGSSDLSAWFNNAVTLYRQSFFPDPSITGENIYFHWSINNWGKASFSHWSVNKLWRNIFSSWSINNWGKKSIFSHWSIISWGKNIFSPWSINNWRKHLFSLIYQ